MFERMRVVAGQAMSLNQLSRCAWFFLVLIGATAKVEAHLLRQTPFTHARMHHSIIVGGSPVIECCCCHRRSMVQSGVIALAGLLPALTPLSSRALTPQEAATQYDKYASTYDRLDGGTLSSALGLNDARRQLVEQARGDVLEIGVGTGLNLDKYRASQLTSLTLVDISKAMLEQTRHRLEPLADLQTTTVTFVQADATRDLVDLFGSNAFDSVVDSFSLCVMGETGALCCLGQIGQVLRPQGRALLLENSRSSSQLLALYQDATADAAAALGGKGCVYNQDVRAMIRATATLQVARETTFAAGLFRLFECSRRVETYS